ncbi:MAG: hypothetical protein ABI169_11435 [Chitinophagaceae bacterium]
MPTLNIPYRPDDREISAGQRVLRTDGAKYNNLFPTPQREDKIVFEDGEVDDTLQLMERVIHTYIDDTQQIAQLLRKEGLADTIQSIWDFFVPKHSVQAGSARTGTTASSGASMGRPTHWHRLRLLFHFRLLCSHQPGVTISRR